MGVLKFLDQKRAASTSAGSQVALKESEKQQKISDVPEPSKPASLPERTEKSIGLMKKDEGEPVPDVVRAGLQETVIAAKKIMEELKDTSEKELDPADETARTDTSMVSKGTPSKTVAVKHHNVSPPARPLEVVPLQSLDPFVNPRGQKKPKVELLSKAELERKRLIEKNKKIGEELEAACRLEKELREKKAKGEEEMRVAEERRKAEEERLAEEKKIEEELKAAEQKVEEELKAAEQKAEEKLKAAEQKAEERLRIAEQKLSADKKRKRKKIVTIEERGKKKMEEEEEEREKRMRVLPAAAPADKEEGELLERTDQPGAEEVEEELKKKEFFAAEALLLQEKELLTVGRKLTAEEELKAHDAAADRVAAIKALRSGKASLADRINVQVPVFIRPSSPVRRHESIIIDTDDILLSHDELKKRRKRGDTAQKKQLERMNLERFRRSGRLELDAGPSSQPARTEYSKDDSSIQEALVNAGLSTPEVALPPPPGIDTPARQMLEGFKAREEVLQAEARAWEQKALSLEEETERRIVTALKEERRSREQIERAQKKKYEDEIADLQRKLEEARDDTSHYRNKSDRLAKEIKLLQTSRANRDQPSSSAAPSSFVPEEEDLALLPEMQRLGVDFSHGITILMTAMNRVHLKAFNLHKQQEQRKKDQQKDL